MRGQGKINIIAENLKATGPRQKHEQWMSRRLRLCWKCQKEKPTKGSHMKMWLGGQMFICKDCVDAKKQGRTNELG